MSIEVRKNVMINFTTEQVWFYKTCLVSQKWFSLFRFVSDVIRDKTQSPIPWDSFFLNIVEENRFIQLIVKSNFFFRNDLGDCLPTLKTFWFSDQIAEMAAIDLKTTDKLVRFNRVWTSGFGKCTKGNKHLMSLPQSLSCPSSCLFECDRTL